MTFLKLGESPADMSHRLCVGGKETRFSGAFRSINYRLKKSVTPECAWVVRKRVFQRLSVNNIFSNRYNV